MFAWVFVVPPVSCFSSPNFFTQEILLQVKIKKIREKKVMINKAEKKINCKWKRNFKGASLHLRRVEWEAVRKTQKNIIRIIVQI